MNLIQTFFSNHLPSGVKRLICLSTLGFRLRNPESMAERRKFVNRINDELNLAEEEGALYFAICFANNVWGEIVNVHSDDVQATVKRLYDAMPEFLKYGEREEVEQEIQTVLTNFS